MIGAQLRTGNTTNPYVNADAFVFFSASWVGNLAMGSVLVLLFRNIPRRKRGRQQEESGLTEKDIVDNRNRSVLNNDGLPFKCSYQLYYSQENRMETATEPITETRDRST